MELTNEFRVGVPVAHAWDVLTDVERIAPCMPGAELQEVEGDEYRGVLKVKVGPITAQYKGAASFVELDPTGRRAVLRAEGRDTRGAGNANATITATLDEDGEGTRVKVVTDLAVTGKVAQFGRGVLNDVSVKLLNQFVDSLESDVLSGPSATEPAWAPAAPAATEPELQPESPPEAQPEPSSPNGSAAPTVRRIESAPARPVDLLDAAGGSVARRAGPAVGAVLFLLWLFTRRRRRKHR